MNKYLNTVVSIFCGAYVGAQLANSLGFMWFIGAPVGGALAWLLYDAPAVWMQFKRMCREITTQTKWAHANTRQEVTKVNFVPNLVWDAVYKSVATIWFLAWIIFIITYGIAVILLNNLVLGSIVLSPSIPFLLIGFFVYNHGLIVILSLVLFIPGVVYSVVAERDFKKNIP